MNIKEQLSKIQIRLFDESLKKDGKAFKSFIELSLNSMISLYEIEKKNAFTQKQRTISKKMLLECKIIPILQDPLQKSLAWGMVKEYGGILNEQN